MKEDDQQEKLMAALEELLQQFGNYGPARVRGDGDIQILLDFDLKKGAVAPKQPCQRLFRDDE